MHKYTAQFILLVVVELMTAIEAGKSDDALKSFAALGRAPAVAPDALRKAIVILREQAGMSDAIRSAMGLWDE